MFGKEIFKIGAKKNKIESNLDAIIENLNRKDLDINVFEVDNGKTDKEYEFITWRFYFKKTNKE